MEPFKVICKATGDWGYTFRELVTEKSFWNGTRTYYRTNDKVVPGPSKDEICIVIDAYKLNNEVYYILQGYPYGGYNSKYFIRLEDLEQTIIEIAVKEEPSLN